MDNLSYPSHERKLLRGRDFLSTTGQGRSVTVTKRRSIPVPRCGHRLDRIDELEKQHKQDSQIIEAGRRQYAVKDRAIEERDHSPNQFFAVERFAHVVALRNPVVVVAVIVSVGTLTIHAIVPAVAS